MALPTGHPEGQQQISDVQFESEEVGTNDGSSVGSIVGDIVLVAAVGDSESLHTNSMYRTADNHNSQCTLS